MPPKKVRKVFRNTIQGVTKPAIARLTKMAGVIRVSDDVYEKSREIITKYLEDISVRLVAILYNERRQTVYVEDISNALPVKAFGASDDRVTHHATNPKQTNSEKKHKFKPGVKARREVHRLLKQSGTLQIPQAVFERVFRQSLQERGKDYRLVEGASQLLQHVVEDYLIELYSCANMISANGGRCGINMKDIEVALTVGSNLANNNNIVGDNFSLLTTKTAIQLGSYIKKILKQVHPEMGMTERCLKQLEFILQIIGGKIACVAKQLTIGAYHAKRKTSGDKVAKEGNYHNTISVRAVQQAVRLIFGNNELAKHAVSELNKAVTKAHSFVPKKGVKATLHKKAGLEFPVTRIRRLLDDSGLRVSDNAAIGLAAVLEYICAELAELSGNSARDYRHKNIRSKDIGRAIDADIELKVFMNLFRIHITGGGKRYFIQAICLPKADKPKKRVKKGLKQSDLVEREVEEDEDSQAESEEESEYTDSGEMTEKNKQRLLNVASQLRAQALEQMSKQQ